MAVGPVRVGYPRISGLVVLGLESGFRSWIFEFGYLKVSGFFISPADHHQALKQFGPLSPSMTLGI
jgi:hypothetical protein